MVISCVSRSLGVTVWDLLFVNVMVILPTVRCFFLLF